MNNLKNYKFEIGQKLSIKANSLIPAGAHTYSKADDQFPSNAPKIIEKGKGCYFWDVDGNKFLDMGMALGSTTLGYAYEPVLQAAAEEMLKGVNFTRPSRIEGELAEIMVEIIPSAEMVKFAKNGSDATTAAVKLARAYTGKDYVARCHQDPFNSVNDWFIGSTIVDRGVPKAVKDLTLKFHYNDIASCQLLFDQHPNQIACFILEPISFMEPKDNFLENLQKLCKKNGALLIFDEVVSGFRFDLGGAQKFINVIPDLSAFGKAMGNGFSLSALVGKREIMKLGGFDHNEEKVFLLSTTHGAETHCLAAGKKVIEIMQQVNLSKHLWDTGLKLKEGVQQILENTKTKHLMDIIGYPCKTAFIPINEKGEKCMVARTLFLQETCARGLLMPYTNLSLSHTDVEIKLALEIIKESILVMKEASETTGMLSYIRDGLVKPVFRKFN